MLEAVRDIRRDSAIPIVLYIYFNLVHRYGVEAFIRDAAQAGVDGLLVLDLPPEEGDEYERFMRQAGLCAICHTVFTPHVDSEGKLTGSFPEQTPYLEWAHSSFGQDASGEVYLVDYGGFLLRLESR